jgi:hypothetical protein
MSIKVKKCQPGPYFLLLPFSFRSFFLQNYPHASQVNPISDVNSKPIFVFMVLLSLPAFFASASPAVVLVAKAQKGC